MSDFQKALEFTLRWEGGYSDHPSDKGGATNRGITQSVYDRYRTKLNLPIQPVKFLHDSELQAIYSSGYWKPVQCGSFEYPDAVVLFDAAVNHGPTRSAKWLQGVVMTKPDGIVGDKTIEAAMKYIFTHGQKSLCRELLNRRDDFYREIVDGNQSQSVFFKGWMNRLNALRLEVGV